MRAPLEWLNTLARTVAFRWRVSVIRLLETFSTRQVAVSELWIRIDSVDDGYMLEVGYVLQAPAASGRILVFSYGDPSLRWVDLTCEGADVVHGTYVFALRRREGTGWDGVHLRIRFLWRYEVGGDLWRRSRFILAPEFLPLPRFRRPPVDGLPPRPAIVVESRFPEGLTVHGIRPLSSTLGPTSQGTFIQLAVNRGGVGDYAGVLSVSTELARRMTAAQCTELMDRAASILRHFSKFFGTAVPGSVLLVDTTDGHEVAGTVILGTASRNPSSPRRVPDWFVLATRLVSIWVGTGCRVVGRNGGEWQLALQGALALLFVRDAASDEFPAYLRRVQNGIHEWTFIGILRWVESGLWYPRRYAIALNMFSALSDHPERLARFATLVRAHWGEDLSVQAVKHALDLDTIP
ncbi:MAG: hypothetical protein AB7I33_15590 [Gemmatimonadales bacterium]